MVYDKTGLPLTYIYDVNGQILQYGYDINGVEVHVGGDPPTRIKVMTYNVGQWYIGNSSNVPAEDDAKYYELQNGILQRANADILFINEYRTPFSGTGRTALSVLSPYFPYIVSRNETAGYMGNAICSKYPLSNFTEHNFAVGNTGYYYNSVDITIDDKNITLICLHLMTSPESDRYLQAQELLDYLKTLDTFIACGDYNTGITPDTEEESTAYAHYVKLFKDEGYHMANFGKEGFLVTYSDKLYDGGSGYDGCLDNIIVSSNINVLSAYVDRTKLTDNIYDKTDHMPLIATLQIN